MDQAQGRPNLRALREDYEEPPRATPSGARHLSSPPGRRLHRRHAPRGRRGPRPRHRHHPVPGERRRRRRSPYAGTTPGPPPRRGTGTNLETTPNAEGASPIVSTSPSSSRSSSYSSEDRGSSSAPRTSSGSSGSGTRRGNASRTTRARPGGRARDGDFFLRNPRARRAPSLKDIHRAATPSVVAVVTAATAPHGRVSVIESVLPVVVVVARRSERADVSSRAAAGSSGSRAAAGPSDGPSASASRARRFHTPCRRRPRRFLRVHGRSLRAAAAFAAEPEEERNRSPRRDAEISTSRRRKPPSDTAAGANRSPIGGATRVGTLSVPSGRTRSDGLAPSPRDASVALGRTRRRALSATRSTG